MKRYLFLPLILMAGSAVVLSFLLVPSEKEVALIRFKNKEYGEAFERYQEMWRNGDRSTAVVVPLSNLYLQYGNVDRALEIMEEFVQEHPQNLEARNQLGLYYQYAQRPSDYVRNLEIISALHPSEETLRELSANYNFEGDFQRQVRVLQRLLQIHPGTVQDFVDLAYLQAAEDLFQEALVSLDEMRRRYPEEITTELTKLYVSLALDAEETERAFERAASWIEDVGKVPAVIELVSVFTGKGQPELALELMNPYEASLERYPLLLREFVRILIDTGQPARAMQRLEPLYKDDLLPVEIVPEMIELAVLTQRSAIALDLARSTHMGALEEWLSFGLVEMALSLDDTDFVRKASLDLGVDGFLSRPVLGARVSLSLGEEDRARTWMEQARSDPGLAFEDRLLLTELYETLGEPDLACTVICPFFEKGLPDDPILERAAWLFMLTGRIQEGFELLDSAKKRSSNIESPFAWALLAAASGQPDKALKWLRSTTRTIPAERLMDLFFTASDRHQVDLALSCAERLFRDSPTRDHRQRLAFALFEANRPAEALRHIRLLPSRSREENDLYLALLQAVRKLGAPVDLELRQYWLRQLRTGTTSPETEEDAVYGLVELSASQEVLPFLYDLANRQPDKWMHLFVEQAVKTGSTENLICYLRRQAADEKLSTKLRVESLYLLIDLAEPADVIDLLEAHALRASHDWFYSCQALLREMEEPDRLHRFWKRYLLRPDLKAEERRGIAFQLLEAGLKSDAVEEFRHLAERSGAEKEDMEQLLFLWGPKPSPEQLDWIEERFRQAGSVAAQVEWIQRLSDRGQHARVVTLIQRFFPGYERDLPVATHYARALAQLGEQKAATQFLENLAHKVDSPGDLAPLLAVSLELGSDMASAAVAEKLLALKPFDPAANKVLGRYAFVNGRYTQAGELLERCLKKRPSDAETLFLLAEIQRREKRQRASIRYYQLALKSLRNSKKLGFVEEVIEAKVLNRLGAHEESESLFRRLIHEHPTDGFLKADFITFLLEHKRYREAEVLLGTVGRSNG